MLFAAIAVLWVRSYWVSDAWFWCPLNDRDQAAIDDYLAVSEHGALYAHYLPASDSALRGFSRSPWNFLSLPSGPALSPFPPNTIWRRWGFGYTTYTSVRSSLNPPPQHGWMFRMPHWAAAAGTFVLPALWLCGRYRKKRWARPGLCPACGYDLRATPQKGGALLSRCPECGAVPAAKGAA